MIVDQHGKPVRLSLGELSERVMSKMALKHLKRSFSFMESFGPKLFDHRGNEIYLGPKVIGTTVEFRLPFTRTKESK